MDNKTIKIVFMGTAEFAVLLLKTLASNFNVVLTVTPPDKPAGRKQTLTACPVKQAAMEYGLPISQPEKIKNNPEFLAALEKANPDLIVVAAYGKILPAEIINLPEHGCLNVHGSLLPKYRGAAPIQSALANGDKITGASIILMDLGMDTGDIVAQESVEIAEDDYYQDLSKKLSQKSAELLVETIPRYINGEINLQMQDDDQATYAYRLTPDSGKIHWVQSARAIHNRIRALADNQGSYANYQAQRLNIQRASVCSNENHDQTQAIGQISRCPGGKNEYCVKCGKGFLRLEQIQLQGKKNMTAAEFANGRHEFISAILK